MMANGSNRVEGERPRPRWVLVGAAALFSGPLIGGLWRGTPPVLLEFPPRTYSLEHAPFSAPVFTLLAILVAATAILLIVPRPAGIRARETPSSPAPAGTPAFPLWMWSGLALIALAWPVAWAEAPFLQPLRHHAFFPLWLGYILVADALVFRRTGTSRLNAAPGRFVALFPASAVSWWYFEYINRFVQNWWYVGVAPFSALHYIIFATLCFSTVIPAVLETADLLGSLRWFRTRYAAGPRLPAPGPALNRVLVAAGWIGLILMARWPNPLFFLTWLAPLAVLAGILPLARQRSPLDALARGDARELVALAVAALVCGFFWEMWNSGSFPKWHYTVPYVQAFEIFEMPVLGYSGYLPFGPICAGFWFAALALFGRRPQ